MLMNLVSSLLHLIATAYFLLVELLGDNEIAFSLLQFIWLVVHAGRMILVVEPCHLTHFEAHKTVSIISDSLRRPFSASVREKVERFRIVGISNTNLHFDRLVGLVLAPAPLPPDVLQCLWDVQAGSQHYDGCKNYSHVEQVKSWIITLSQYCSAIATYLVILIQFQNSDK